MYFLKILLSEILTIKKLNSLRTIYKKNDK